MRRPPAAALLLACLPLAAGAEGRAGGQLVIDGLVAEDLYAAAGTVLVPGAVDGDAVVAGGTVGIAGDVSGDALVAGGSIDLAGVIGDDLRAVGGSVTVRGLVTDQAIVAAGTVVIAPESAVGGRAWLAGNTIEVAGQVGGNLRATADTVLIGGNVGGTVEVTARQIRLLPGATIGGDFVWRSAVEPDIAEDARIFGAIVGGAPATDEPGLALGPAESEAPRVLLGIAVFLAAAVLWRLFPGFVQRAGAAFRAAPGRTLLTGAVAFLATPLAILVLFASLVGWLLAFVLAAGYALGLAATGLLALVAMADGVAARGGPAPSWGRRLVLLLLVTAAAILLQGVPGLTVLVTVGLWIAGLGMAVRALRSPATGTALPPA